MSYSTATTTFKSNKLLNYKDIYLIPRKSIISSRDDADCSIDFLGTRFANNVVPANMASVVNEKICKELSEQNIFYIYHRFGNTWDFIINANDQCWRNISISVGVKQADKDLIAKIAGNRLTVDFITIDIAHGFSESVVEMITYIKSCFNSVNQYPKIIAGNVWGDKDSIEFLQNAGADAIKIGLSHGGACSTYGTTGFGSPMFSAALEAGEFSNIPLIIDGGIREYGDIAKATVAALQYNKDGIIPMVMAGSLFAACKDAPGESLFENNPDSIYSDVITHKRYYGSASALNKANSKQEVKHIEGFEVKLPCNGLTVEQQYEKIRQALSSSISYAGGKDLSCLGNVNWGYIN